MNALPKFPQHPKFPQQRPPLRSPVRRASVQPSNVRVSRQYRLVAFETCLRLGVNVGLSAIALSTLVYLVPYRTAQAQKLKEVQSEVQQTEARVAQIQAEFSRNFDSSQVKAILQEQTHMVDPSQRVVIFDDRIPVNAGKSDKVAQTP